MGRSRGSHTECYGQYLFHFQFQFHDENLNLQGEPGPAILIEELVKAAKKESPQTRAAGMGLLQTLCSKGSADLTEHIPHLIIFTTEAFNDPSDAVCERAWLSLEALVKVQQAKRCRPFNNCVCSLFSMLIQSSCLTILATCARV